MKAWEEVREARTDMSQYVMHCTKPKWDPKAWASIPADEVLKRIIYDGFLRATFAVMKSPFGSRAKPTIRGPYPAVCFTEQPLQFFRQTLAATYDKRYSEFAIAVRKDDLFDYGGRPVIYDDEPVLGSLVDDANAPPEALVYDGGLPRDVQYRWVGYDPTALWDRPYPVDWTHEREWRARPNMDRNYRAGFRDLECTAVPLLVPTLRYRAAQGLRFIILVDTDGRKSDLEQWIEGNLSEIADVVPVGADTLRR